MRELEYQKKDLKQEQKEQEHYWHGYDHRDVYADEDRFRLDYGHLDVHQHPHGYDDHHFGHHDFDEHLIDPHSFDDHHSDDHDYDHHYIHEHSVAYTPFTHVPVPVADLHLPSLEA